MAKITAGIPAKIATGFPNYGSSETYCKGSCHIPARTVTGLRQGIVAKSQAIIAARMPARTATGLRPGDSSEVAGNNSGKDATGTAATTTARTMVGTDGKDHKAAYSNDS